MSKLEIEEITVAELQKLGSENILVIDVREEEEFLEVRAAGAILLPLDQVPENAETLPKGERIYIICASGNRSMVACEYLSDRGYSPVNIIGGTKAWMSAGNDVITGPISDSSYFPPS
jgi:rhodanese-related sulfurtransferase